jgi:hypothetical protein
MRMILSEKILPESLVNEPSAKRLRQHDATSPPADQFTQKGYARPAPKWPEGLVQKE